MELTPAGAGQIVNMADSLQSARQIDQSVRQDQIVRRYKVYLDGSANNLAARSILVGTSFKAFAVTDASDATAKAFMCLNKQDDSGGIESFTLVNGVSHDFGEKMNGGYVYWTTSQSGRWIEISFFSKGIYKNNTINLNNSGGSALLDGTAIVTDASQNANGTAAILIPASATRKAAIIENQGTDSIFLGGSNVTVPGGANPGITLLPGGQIKWNNQAALYGITSGSTVAVAVAEET